jgi:type II secretory pathway pseudopilin PulG
MIFIGKKNKNTQGFTPSHVDSCLHKGGRKPVEIQRKNNSGFFGVKSCARGFTLIEAVFAIFIIGATLMTFFSVMAAMIRSEYDARDQIVASNLAQEGIEMARNYRDNNWKNGQLAFCLGNSSGAKNKCKVPIPPNIAGIFPGNRNNTNPYTEVSIQFLIIDDYLKSKFGREIMVQDGPEFKTITSTVTIKRTGKTVEITDILYPWADGN